MSCGCGCGEPRAGRSAYASPACRTRAWKHRVKYGPQKPLQGRSNANESVRRHQSGLQLPFRTTVDVLATLFIAPPPPSTSLQDAQERAERLLTHVLSARQRKQLINRKAGL